MPDGPEVQLRLPNYNEVMDGALPRDPYGPMLATLAQIGTETFVRRIEMANEINRREGVTFSLNPTDGDRILPVDWLPRIIPADHWDTIERGLKQRITALNLLCHDVYNGRQTIVPEEILATCPYFYPECIGLRVPHDIYIHVYGPDLLHLGNGKYVVLEDNTRIPSGVSYAVKYREVTKRVIPELFRPYRIRRIDDYGQVFLRNLHYFAEGLPNVSNRRRGRTQPPVMVLLTEGTYNAAYYEHKFLSEQMGLPLVEPSDLYIDDDLSCRLHTFDGTARVDLIYRRIQDLETFVPSLVRAYAAGQVGLVNAWGTGIVDDKTVFPYVPALIRHYLGEEPILPNVESYSLAEPAVRRHVLANLSKMVVKSREGYGGHDMLIGPESTRAEQQAFRDKILARPLNYIAQDCVEFSTHLICRTADGTVSLTDSYVDLRTYVLYGQDITVLPGGISRVAQPGTHVVNSSSGGLVKDTWVLEEAF